MTASAARPPLDWRGWNPTYANRAAVELAAEISAGLSGSSELAAMCAEAIAELQAELAEVRAERARREAEFQATHSWQVAEIDRLRGDLLRATAELADLRRARDEVVTERG